MCIVCMSVTTHGRWFRGDSWLLSECSSSQLSHSHVDIVILVPGLHHGRPLLTHLLNEFRDTEILWHFLWEAIQPNRLIKHSYTCCEDGNVCVCVCVCLCANWLGSVCVPLRVAWTWQCQYPVLFLSCHTQH